jgi:hypothetical protein
MTKAFKSATLGRHIPYNFHVFISEKAPNSDLVILKSTNSNISTIWSSRNIKAAQFFEDIVICHHILIFYKVRLKVKCVVILGLEYE